MIVPAITLRILPPTAPVNHRFTAAARNSQFYELVTFGVTWTLTNAGGRALTAQLRGDINRRPQRRNARPSSRDRRGTRRPRGRTRPIVAGQRLVTSELNDISAIRDHRGLR